MRSTHGSGSASWGARRRETSALPRCPGRSGTRSRRSGSTRSGCWACGSEDDLERDPASFVKVGDRVLANGRDPYFPAWPDVVQLNAFSADLRGAVVDTLGRVAEQCDGVRCDMAMLMMNDVFERTWGRR